MRRTLRPGIGLVLLISALAGLACGESPSEPYITGADVIRVNGTLRRFQCWVVRGDDGASYEIAAPPPTLARDGLRVRLTARYLAGMGSVCMSGTPVEVLDLRRE